MCKDQLSTIKCHTYFNLFLTIYLQKHAVIFIVIAVVHLTKISTYDHQRSFQQYETPQKQ